MYVLMLIVLTLVAIVIGAFAYRIGGMSKKEAKEKLPWFPQWLIDGWVRDAACSLVQTGWFIALYHRNFVDAWYWVAVTVSLGWTWGMLTTYWDDWFGYDNFYMHGGMIALAALPFPLYAQLTGYGSVGLWLGFGIRIAVTALLMGIISASTKNVDKEEYGRGGSQQATLPLMVVWK